MIVKYEINLHIYDDYEDCIPFAVETHNMAYVLKITTFKKYATRWHFTIEGDFPKDLSKESIERMKMDTCYRIGFFITKHTNNINK